MSLPYTQTVVSEDSNYEKDWAGLTGPWVVSFCFCDHRDLMGKFIFIAICTLGSTYIHASAFNAANVCLLFSGKYLLLKENHCIEENLGSVAL